MRLPGNRVRSHSHRIYLVMYAAGVTRPGRWRTRARKHGGIHGDKEKNCYGKAFPFHLLLLGRATAVRAREGSGNGLGRGCWSDDWFFRSNVHETPTTLCAQRVSTTAKTIPGVKAPRLGGVSRTDVVKKSANCRYAPRPVPGRAYTYRVNDR